MCIMAQLTEYLWIVIVGFFFAFLYAFGIGANDVANAFGSTVASKSLTLKQAVIVASIFEFLGSLLLGAAVTGTIRNGIFDVKLYDDEPDIVLLGMFTTLITGTIMLLAATALALPVSTTHTIVGCIMGFSIVAKGFSSINWDVVTKIFISWIASPGCSGIIAFLFFGALKILVLDSPQPFERAFYTFPVVLTVFIGIDLFYVLYKGLNNTSAGKLPLSTTLPISFGVGLFVGLVWIFLWGPWVKARIERQAAEKATAEAGKEAGQWDEIDVDGDGDVEKVDGDVEKVDMTQQDGGDSSDDNQVNEGAAPEVAEEEEPKTKFGAFMKKFAESTYDQDLHAQSMHESKRAEEIWDNAQQFDANAEQLFTYVQVFTACLNSFAHGANDVANAIAPVSAILLIYQTGELSKNAPVQKWILAYGGVAIVFGLLLYGYKVMKSIGYKLSALSPSRGASAELAASLFVVTASFLAIPVSSTQSIVGAVTGVGCVGGLKNVQWLFLLRVACGWVGVFLCAVIINAGIFAMLAFSPSLTS